MTSSSSTCTFPDCSTTIDNDALITNLSRRNKGAGSGIVPDRELKQTYRRLFALYNETHENNAGNSRKKGVKWHDVIKKDFEEAEKALKERKIKENRAYLHGIPSLSSLDNNYWRLSDNGSPQRRWRGKGIKSYHSLLAVEDVVPLAQKWVLERTQQKNRQSIEMASYDDEFQECVETTNVDPLGQNVVQQDLQSNEMASYAEFEKYVESEFYFPNDILAYARTDYNPPKDERSAVGKKRPAAALHETALDETNTGKPASMDSTTRQRGYTAGEIQHSTVLQNASMNSPSVHVHAGVSEEGVRMIVSHFTEAIRSLKQEHDCHVKEFRDYKQLQEKENKKQEERYNRLKAMVIDQGLPVPPSPEEVSVDHSNVPGNECIFSPLQRQQIGTSENVSGEQPEATDAVFGSQHQNDMGRVKLTEAWPWHIRNDNEESAENPLFFSVDESQEV